MKDQSKTKNELLEDISVLKKKIKKLEKSPTTRKNAESPEAFRESDLRLKAQYQGNPVATFTWQKKGKDFELVDFNDAAKVITSGKVEMFIGNKASKLYAKQKDILQDIQRCFLKKEIIRREIQSHHFLPGKLINITIVFVPNDLVNVYLEDISERKFVESQKEAALEALRKNEEKYRLVVENAQEAIVVIQDFKAVFINRAAADMTGYSEELLSSRSFMEFIHPDDCNMVIENHVKRLKGEKPPRIYSYRIICRNGDIKWAETNSIAVQWRGKPAILNFLSDITVRKTAESQREAALEALRESEERLRFALEGANDGLWDVNLNTNSLFISPRGCEILGYKPNEMQELVKAWVDLVHPEDLTATNEKLENYLSGLTNIFEVEQRLKMKSGEWKWVLSRGKIVQFDKQGKPERMTGTHTDITENRLVEDALKKSEDKYRTLIETTDTGFVIIGQDGLVKDANSEYVRLAGYSDLSEIVGRSVMEWTADYEKEKNVAALKACFEKRYIRNFEIDYVDTKGRITPIELNATCLEIDGKVQTITICRDITERKKAAEEMMASEDRFRLMSSIATEGIMIRQGNTIIDTNQAFANLCGYSSPQELIGKNGTEIIPFTPESRQKIINHIQASSADPYDVEIIARDGSILSLEVQGQTVPISYKGQEARIVFMRNVTDRKKAEDNIRKREEMLRSVFKAVPIGICIMKNRVYQSANNFWCEQFGYPEETIIGKDTRMLYESDEEFNRVGKELYSYLQEKGLASIETRLRRSDGIFRDVIVTAAFLLSDDPDAGTIAIIQDITDRKQAEQEILNSRERLSSFMNSATDSFYLLDSNLHFIDVNEKSLKITGLNREQIIGKDIREIVPDVVTSGRYARHLEVMRTGEPFIIEDFIPHPVFGNLYFMLKSFKVGNGLGVIATEITELKKVEEEKRTLEERLQRAEKMEALGTLAGGVAHDLNNVLGVIVGYSELLLNETDISSPVRPRLTKIMNGTEKAAAIVQDLLTLARRGVSGRKVFNLNKLVLDYKNSPEWERLFSYNSAVQMKIDLEPDLLNVSGSSVHLGKTLFNLVTNAVEAMPKGGELTIKTSNQYLDKSIYGYDEIREGDYVVLSITDTGEGISATDMQRIFEPFYTKKVMGRSGTGLGLAVVWGTVKDHQGYINVQSEEGKGSTFTLYFPVTRENVTTESLPVSVNKYMGKGETILVVDDVREQRELAMELLKKLNYQVVSVASGEEAIAYVKEHKIDLLVLDMIMEPGMDGLDTYKRILEIQPQQKAIIVSGFSETERVNEAHSLGAGAYVKKPYVIEKLGVAVRNELDRVT